jgi:hypothetical protein
MTEENIETKLFIEYAKGLFTGTAIAVVGVALSSIVYFSCSWANEAKVYQLNENSKVIRVYQDGRDSILIENKENQFITLDDYLRSFPEDEMSLERGSVELLFK